jgi:hypothetical protein
MSTPAPSPNAILHSGRYSYHKRSILVIGAGITLVTGGIGLKFLLTSGPSFPTGAAEWLALAFVGGILGLLFSCGVFLVASYFRNHGLDLVITHTEIRYGKNTFPWADVRWVGGVAANSGCHLAIGRRGFRPDQQLMTDAALDEPAFDRLMETLRREVLPAHPSLKLVDIRNGE